MAGGRGKDQMHTIPEEVEGRHSKIKGDTHAGHVIQVLHWVHREAREGLDVRVSVVEGVDEFVEGAEVEEAVGEVEVDVAEERDGEGPEEEGDEGGGRGEGGVGDVGEAVGGPEVHEEGFPPCLGGNAKEVVPDVVEDEGGGREVGGIEFSFGPPKEVQGHVPEADVGEDDGGIYEEAMEDPVGCPDLGS
jgi:hypothetical protein